MTPEWLAPLLDSPWLLIVLFAVVVGDAFLVVLPGETAVVALGTLAVSTGSPALGAVLAVAAAGAVLGDSACWAIGRRIGLDRWAWQRRGRVAEAISRVRTLVTRRTAVLLFTARYVPFARIAANLAAGAAPVPFRRFLPLAAMAGVGWALYNVGVGAVVGRVLPDQPVLAVAVSVTLAMVLGVAIDRLVARFGAARSTRSN